MKYVPKAVTRGVGRTVLKAQKNSPTLLFVGGIIGVSVGTVLACRATMRVEDVLVDTQKQLLEADRVFTHINRTAPATEDQSDLNKAKAHIYIDSAWKMTKLYGPAVLCMAVSVGCLTKSHRILSDRNTQLTAAYVGLQRFLEGYRGRVRQEIGEEKERDVYYASTPIELAQDTANGPIKTFGTAPGMKSPYSGIFGPGNGNYQDSHEFNVHFLRIQEQTLTDKLRAQGSLMLNEVYDRLDMPRTPIGAITGWMIGHQDSDDFVEFDIIPLHDNYGSLMVDFNVAGVVYDMLHGRVSGRTQ